MTVTLGGEERVHQLLPGENPLDRVREELAAFTPVELPDLPRLIGGAVGYVGYDMARHFERLPATARPAHDVPDLVLLLVDTLVIFDHVQHQLILLANAHNTGDPDASYDECLAVGGGAGAAFAGQDATQGRVATERRGKVGRDR